MSNFPAIIAKASYIQRDSDDDDSFVLDQHA
jgi:hypothetical protein